MTKQIPTNLADVCIIQRGTVITKKDTILGDVPVVGGGVKPTYYHNTANRNSGAITVSGSGANAGYINYWSVPIFASDCTTIESKNPNTNISYLYYNILSKQQFIYDNFRSGSAQPHVYARDIAQMKIDIHLPREQKRIAGVLDAVKALMQKRERTISLLDELKQTIFIDMFGDPRVPRSGTDCIALGSICNPKQHKTIPTSKLKNTGYPIFGANGQIGFFDSFTHKKPTIAITCRGATCGTINVTPANCYITGNAMALDALDESKVTLKFLALYLQIRGFSDVISGSAQPQIVRGSLLNFQIFLPNLKQQFLFNEIVSKIENAEQIAKQSMFKLNELFNSLQHQFFSRETQKKKR